MTAESRMESSVLEAMSNVDVVPLFRQILPLRGHDIQQEWHA